jgi:hypothetical protein
MDAVSEQQTGSREHDLLSLNLSLFWTDRTGRKADQQRFRAIQAAGIFVHTPVAGAIAFAGPFYTKNNIYYSHG